MANMKRKKDKTNSLKREAAHRYLADPKTVSGLEIISSRILQGSEIFPPPCLQQKKTPNQQHITLPPNFHEMNSRIKLLHQVIQVQIRKKHSQLSPIFNTRVECKET